MTVTHRTAVITILMIFVQMLLIAFQYNLNVLLKQYVVMAVPSLTRYPLFEIYYSTYYLFRKNWKAGETISKFAETLFIVFLPCADFHNKELCYTALHRTNKSNSLCLCVALYRYSRTTSNIPLRYTLYKWQQREQTLSAVLRTDWRRASLHVARGHDAMGVGSEFKWIVTWYFLQWEFIGIQN